LIGIATFIAGSPGTAGGRGSHCGAGGGRGIFTGRDSNAAHGGGTVAITMIDIYIVIRVSDPFEFH
jgi:hypothetical protein